MLQPPLSTRPAAPRLPHPSASRNSQEETACETASKAPVPEKPAPAKVVQFEQVKVATKEATANVNRLLRYDERERMAGMRTRIPAAYQNVKQTRKFRIKNSPTFLIAP